LQLVPFGGVRDHNECGAFFEVATLSQQHVTGSESWAAASLGTRLLVGIRKGFAAGVVSAGLGVCASLAAAAEPPAIEADADTRHELRARQALMRDASLAPLNLGVRVQKHVAVLWGPVPSADLGRRAVEVLKQLPELMEVRNELHVQPSEEPPTAVSPLPVPPAERPLPLQDRPTRPPTASAGVLTRHTPKTDTPKGNPEPPSPPAKASWVPPDQAAFAPKENLILPAIDIPNPSTSGNLARGEWLIEAVSRLLRSDSRYQDLRPEVRGKVVHLKGEVERWADVYELAQRITRLSGVERVVLADVRSRKNEE
jgi:osmotically-inducible protein OsmY